MEPEILKTVGQIAGIGGLSLGLALLLFREIIRKNIFPRLSKNDAYRLLRLIGTFVFILALVGLVFWFLGERSNSDQGGRVTLSPPVYGSEATDSSGFLLLTVNNNNS